MHELPIRYRLAAAAPSGAIGLAGAAPNAPIDGAPNDDALAAVRKDQPQHHLPVTGEPDTATLDKQGLVDRQSTAATQSGGTEHRVLIQAAPMQAMQRASSMSMIDGMGTGPITADAVQGEPATMTGGVSLKASR